MTLRIKISHLEPQSAWKLVVSNTYEETVSTIRPGGSMDFLIHSSKDITISEVLNQQTEKNGEAEASPS